MKKRGLSKATIETRTRKLKRLVKLGCDLTDSDEVAATIAKQDWNTNTKADVCAIYTSFLKCFGLTWEPPRYKPNYEVPFIPTEAEIDQLIAGTGKKMAALLQLLKETAIRIGEVSRIRWIDLDAKQKVVRVRAEKHSNPGIFHISDKLLNMLNMIPRKSERVFNSNPKVLETHFFALRKRLAQRFSNPRLKEIHFHTLRHWKATMLYHKTKDVLYVNEFLGHKRLDSTLKYINMERALFYKGKPEEFHVRIAKGPEDIRGCSKLASNICGKKTVCCSSEGKDKTPRT